MPEDTALEYLILNYCRHVGGLVELPAYGVHEVLLPDEVAARWGIDSIQRFVFNPEAKSEVTAGIVTMGDAVTLIDYSHPLVETIVEELRQQTANGLFYVNNVRLEKPGLFSVIEKAFDLANAKLFPAHGGVEQKRLYHLVRFNFKASLISDEKRELVLPVWMNLQGGYAVKGAEIERLAILDDESQFIHLPLATPYFMEGDWPVLSLEVLSALLERARRAALIELAPNLERLQKRLQRLLELDHARLTEYYTDLIKGVEKRLRNAEEERKPALNAKLAAIQAECQSKLADVEQKYRLRVELELVNLALIVQPKLDLIIEIKNRRRTVQRRVVWDPLRHIVEPLVCDVCGLTGYGLYLCEEGHLVHADCLAPQCVECKRTYCQQCADKVQICVVCDRPVCYHSLVKCPQCRRVTCHDHLNECHAADGAPRRPEAQSKPLAKDIPTVSASAATESATLQKSPRKKEAAKAKPSTTRPKPSVTPAVIGDYLEVIADPAQSAITAIVMVKKREIAGRRWEMTDEGIYTECHCQKGSRCERDGIVYRPAPDNMLEVQIMGLITELRIEYGVSATKMHFYQIRQGVMFDERKLKLPSKWRDTAVLAEARQGFDRLVERNARR